MTLILVMPGGGRAAVIAAGMTAAASVRGAKVNLGALSQEQVEPAAFAQAVVQQHSAADLVIVFFEDDAGDPEFVYRICEAAEDADLDLVLHLAASTDTDRAVEAVDALRKLGMEPSGLVIDKAPIDETKYVEARQFLSAAAGVPVIGALPEGAEALEPAEFARASVKWFDEDETYDD